MTMPQMSSELGELARLAVQMEDLAQRVMGASENVPDEVTVVDGTESLLITMRRDGSVADFQMESDWKDSIEPDDLGDALTMLLGEAQYELMSDFDEALAESYDGPQEDEGDESINFLTDPRVREFEAGVEEFLENSRSDVVPLEQAREDADAYIDRVRAMLADPSLGADSGEPDCGSPVRCERMAGRPTAIHVDGYWAGTTPFVTVRAAIRNELTTAAEDVSALSQDLASQGTAVLSQLIGNMMQPLEFPERRG